MKLHPHKLALSTAVVVAFLYAACWLIVVALPDASMTMTEHMLHMRMDQSAWNMTAQSLFVGALAWAVTAALTVWLVVVLYNKLEHGSSETTT